MLLPDPVPVILEIQALLERGSCWRQGGLDPATGLGCYGLIWYAYGCAGIALPETAEEGQHCFTIIQPPYQQWDVVLAHFGQEADARHVALLLMPPEGFHCSWMTNGLARFSLHQALWRRITRHVLRYKHWTT